VRTFVGACISPGQSALRGPDRDVDRGYAICQSSIARMLGVATGAVRGRARPRRCLFRVAARRDRYRRPVCGSRFTDRARIAEYQPEPQKIDAFVAEAPLTHVIFIPEMRQPHVVIRKCKQGPGVVPIAGALLDFAKQQADDASATYPR